MKQLRLRLFTTKRGLPSRMSLSTQARGQIMSFRAKPRARDVGPNGSGRWCRYCGAVTYGLSEVCGQCGTPTGLAL